MLKYKCGLIILVLKEFVLETCITRILSLFIQFVQDMTGGARLLDSSTDLPSEELPNTPIRSTPSLESSSDTKSTFSSVSLSPSSVSSFSVRAFPSILKTSSSDPDIRRKEHRKAIASSKELDQVVLLDKAQNSNNPRNRNRPSSFDKYEAQFAYSPYLLNFYDKRLELQYTGDNIIGTNATRIFSLIFVELFQLASLGHYFKFIFQSKEQKLLSLILPAIGIILVIPCIILSRYANFRANRSLHLLLTILLCLQQLAALFANVNQLDHVTLTLLVVRVRGHTTLFRQFYLHSAEYQLYCGIWIVVSTSTYRQCAQHRGHRNQRGFRLFQTRNCTCSSSIYSRFYLSD